MSEKINDQLDLIFRLGTVWTPSPEELEGVRAMTGRAREDAARAFAALAEAKPLLQEAARVAGEVFAREVRPTSC